MAKKFMSFREAAKLLSITPDEFRARYLNTLKIESAGSGDDLMVDRLQVAAIKMQAEQSAVEAPTPYAAKHSNPSQTSASNRCFASDVMSTLHINEMQIQTLVDKGLLEVTYEPDPHTGQKTQKFEYGKVLGLLGDESLLRKHLGPNYRDNSPEQRPDPAAAAKGMTFGDEMLTRKNAVHDVFGGDENLFARIIASSGVPVRQPGNEPMWKRSDLVIAKAKYEENLQAQSSVQVQSPRPESTGVQVASEKSIHTRKFDVTSKFTQTLENLINEAKAGETEVGILWEGYEDNKALFKQASSLIGPAKASASRLKGEDHKAVAAALDAWEKVASPIMKSYSDLVSQFQRVQSGYIGMRTKLTEIQGMEGIKEMEETLNQCAAYIAQQLERDYLKDASNEIARIEKEMALADKEIKHYEDIRSGAKEGIFSPDRLRLAQRKAESLKREHSEADRHFAQGKDILDKLTIGRGKVSVAITSYYDFLSRAVTMYRNQAIDAMSAYDEGASAVSEADHLLTSHQLKTFLGGIFDQGTDVVNLNVSNYSMHSMPRVIRGLSMILGVAIEKLKSGRVEGSEESDQVRAQLKTLQDAVDTMGGLENASLSVQFARQVQQSDGSIEKYQERVNGIIAERDALQAEVSELKAKTDADKENFVEKAALMKAELKLGRAQHELDLFNKITEQITSDFASGLQLPEGCGGYGQGYNFEKIWEYVAALPEGERPESIRLAQMLAQDTANANVNPLEYARRLLSSHFAELGYGLAKLRLDASVAGVSRLSELIEKYAGKGDDREALLRSLKERADRAETAEAARGTAVEELRKLKARNHELENEQSENITTLKVASTELDSFKKEKEANAARIAVLEKEIAEAQAKYDSDKAALNAVSAAAEAAHMQRIDSIQGEHIAELQKTVKDRASLQQAVEAALADADSARKENAKFVRDAYKIAELRDHMPAEDLASILMSVGVLANDLKTKKAALDAAVAGKATVEAELTDAQASLEEALKAKNEAEARLAASTAKKSKNAEKKAAREASARVKLIAAESEVSRLQHEVNELNSRLVDSEFRRVYNHLRERVGPEEADNFTANYGVFIKQTTSMVYLERITWMNQQVSAAGLEALATVRETLLNEKDEQRKQYEAHVEKLNSDLTEANNRSAILQNDLNEARAEVDRLTDLVGTKLKAWERTLNRPSQLEKMKNELKNAEELVKRARERASAAETNLMAAAVEKDRALEKLGHFTGLIPEVDSHIEEIIDACNESRKADARRYNLDRKHMQKDAAGLYTVQDFERYLAKAVDSGKLTGKVADALKSPDFRDDARQIIVNSFMAYQSEEARARLVDHSHMLGYLSIVLRKDSSKVIAGEYRDLEGKDLDGYIKAEIEKWNSEHEKQERLPRNGRMYAQARRIMHLIAGSAAAEARAAGLEADLERVTQKLAEESASAREAMESSEQYKAAAEEAQKVISADISGMSGEDFEKYVSGLKYDIAKQIAAKLREGVAPVGAPAASAPQPASGPDAAGAGSAPAPAQSSLDEIAELRAKVADLRSTNQQIMDMAGGMYLAVTGEDPSTMGTPADGARKVIETYEAVVSQRDAAISERDALRAAAASAASQPAPSAAQPESSPAPKAGPAEINAYRSQAESAEAARAAAEAAKAVAEARAADAQSAADGLESELAGFASAFLGSFGPVYRAATGKDLDPSAITQDSIPGLMSEVQSAYAAKDKQSAEKLAEEAEKRNKAEASAAGLREEVSSAKADKAAAEREKQAAQGDYQNAIAQRIDAEDNLAKAVAEKADLEAKLADANKAKDEADSGSKRLEQERDALLGDYSLIQVEAANICKMPDAEYNDFKAKNLKSPAARALVDSLRAEYSNHDAALDLVALAGADFEKDAANVKGSMKTPEGRAFAEKVAAVYTARKEAVTSRVSLGKELEAVVKAVEEGGKAFSDDKAFKELVETFTSSNVSNLAYALRESYEATLKETKRADAALDDISKITSARVGEYTDSAKYAQLEGSLATKEGKALAAILRDRYSTLESYQSALRSLGSGKIAEMSKSEFAEYCKNLHPDARAAAERTRTLYEEFSSIMSADLKGMDDTKFQEYLANITVATAKSIASNIRSAYKSISSLESSLEASNKEKDAEKARADKAESDRDNYQAEAKANGDERDAQSRRANAAETAHSWADEAAELNNEEAFKYRNRAVAQKKRAKQAEADRDSLNERLEDAHDYLADAFDAHGGQPAFEQDVEKHRFERDAARVDSTRLNNEAKELFIKASESSFFQGCIYRRALGKAEQAMGIDPSNPESIYLTARCLAVLGQEGEAAGLLSHPALADYKDAAAHLAMLNLKHNP